MKKYEKTYDVEDYEILTDTGWEEIKTVSKTIQYEIWQIKTINCELLAADTHILFDENFNEVFLKDLKIR
jgi:hypothetical protein